jgi:hypothetical protein
MMCSSYSKDSIYPASRSRAVITWPVLSYSNAPTNFYYRITVKSMRIHTNTNTIYHRWCKSWSLRHLVQSLFSWFSRLPMTTSVWQVWRSLRHKAGCAFRQSLRLWIRWVPHRSTGNLTPEWSVGIMVSNGILIWDQKQSTIKSVV